MPNILTSLYFIVRYLMPYPKMSVRVLSTGSLILALIFSIFSSTAVAQKSEDRKDFLTQETSVDGITVDFKLPQLLVTQAAPDATIIGSEQHIVYDTVRYSGCEWLQEPGYPRLPVTRVLLAVPSDVNLNDMAISVTAGPSKVQNGVMLLVRNREKPSNVDTTLYPSVLARIEMDGYIRSQRVISLALHPVQYNLKTRVLRSYSSLTVTIPFKTQLSGRRVRGAFNAMPTDINRPSSLFEQTFAQHILNYSEYGKLFNIYSDASQMFGARIGSLPAAPGLIDDSLQTRYKLFVDDTGIYKVTAASLREEWGVDLIGVDPRKLRMKHGDQEIPIYVSGAVDGSFDAEDAILFLAHSSTDPVSPYEKNAYTLWNIYWLMLAGDGQHSARVSQIEASPSDTTAVQVPTFRSRVVFEEDHLSNNLEFVHPDDASEGDKHKWFDALDFWYWDGIKNASEIGEMRLNFPLYDLAKSFDTPQIQVVLQGGTPASHQILASVNGIKIDLASWEQQAQVTLSKNLRAWNNLKDASQGEMNVLSLTRVDDTFEEDTTRYPYHIYLNRFWVYYTRLFLAVNDKLRFGTPTMEDNSEEQGVTHQFRIDGFLDPQISVFETDGNTLTAKLQGVQVTHHAIDDVMRDRLRTLNAGDLRAVPNSTYSATFQVPDTRTTEFIAVAKSAMLTPVQVETVPPSDLKSTLNGVDYLVLTHPRYKDSAERLANWRSTAGGGYRTKVVDVNDVYNTFGDGTVHPLWIKRFLTYAYHNWASPALSYLVIFGDGTFDFRGIDKEIYPEPPELAGYIPTHYITTDSFGRTSTDHWFATVSGYDEFVDFYVGRLTVENEAEADAVIDKIINYESKTPNGAWRRRVISVADDEVSNIGDHIFKQSLNEIAKDHTRLGYETVEIYLEDVIDEVQANPEQFDDTLPRHIAKDRIINALGEGAVIAQYAGHGGRIVWAHESIFDNNAVDRVEETTHLPFMLVLSCYNGYFDSPGQPSMAEKLLRKERGGIIAMLSATRLTYGFGNEALNRIIFDMLFQRNIRQLGPLSFDSKLELLLTEGTGQLDVMSAYTLFGDPAMQIAMADYEILPAIETKTVKPGDTLKISPGYIQNARYNAAEKRKIFTHNTNFDGTLTVKAVFPGKQAVGIDLKGNPKEYYTGDVIVTKRISVSRGNFPAVEVEVPENISTGDGHLEYYAENATEIAVGGDSFTVGVPKILDIKPEVVKTPSGEDMIEISVHVSDDEKNTVSVVLEWRHPKTGIREKVSLEPSEVTSPLTPTARWWKTPEPLPSPTDGSAFRYDIEVTDSDGFVVLSDYYRFYPYTYPNLSVVSKRGSLNEQIRYTLDVQENAPYEQYLSADIEVAGTVNSQNADIADSELLDVLGLTDVDVEVAFFVGNPDIDGNGVIDDDANLLGKTLIKPNDWVIRNPLYQRSNAYIPDPLNTNPIATVAIPISLRIGVHDVFVYVDPIFDEADKPGKVLENNERDNIGYRQLTVSSSIIGAELTSVKSVDGGLRMSASSRVWQNKPFVLSTQPIVLDAVEMDADYFIGGTGKVRDTTTNEPFLDIKNDQNRIQTDSMLTPVALPTHPSLLGYTLHLNDVEMNNLFELQTPASVELDFDFTALQQQIIRELFGSDMDMSDEGQTIEGNVSTGVEERVKNIGAYLWLDAIANWAKLESEIKRRPNGSIYTTLRATRIRNENTSDGKINDVVISTDGAEVGTWVVLMENARTYRLLFIPERTNEATVSNNGRIEEIVRDIPIVSYSGSGTTQLAETLNFDIDFEVGETPFQFGDMLRFRITELEGGEDIFESYVSSFFNRNRGNGNIQYIDLPEETTIPQDTWLVMFVSSTEFQIEGKNTGVLTKDGTSIYGKVGEPFEHSDYGLNLLITQGPTPFAAGDRFLFDTSMVGTVRATTAFLGHITCLHSEDTIPPDIQLTIGNQKHFVTGSPVDDRPLIQATVSDARGIDYITRPFELALGRLGEFETIPETEYRLTQHPGSKQTVLTYNSTKLEPREYQLRLIASDLDGNKSEREISFQVHGKLQLVEPLNFPNPFSRETTVVFDLTRPAKSLTVKIYTLTGRLIRKLETDEPPGAGFNKLKWDGRDSDGNEVANGVYYGKMIVEGLDGEENQTHILKMMKLK